MGGEEMSEHHAKQFKKFSELESLLYDKYRTAKNFQMDLEKLFELKNKYYDDPQHSKLVSYYVGKLSGIDSCLFAQIQNEHTEWKHYYVNKNEKTIYVNKWEKLPQYIKNNGEFFGNYFWKRTQEQIKANEEPRPFGNPSVGLGLKKFNNINKVKLG